MATPQPAAGHCGSGSSLVADGLQAARPLHDVRDEQQSRRSLDGFYGNQETLQRKLVVHRLVGKDVGAKLHPPAVRLLQNQHLEIGARWAQNTGR